MTGVCRNPAWGASGQAVEPIGDGEFLAGSETPADLAVRTDPPPATAITFR